MRIVQRYFVVNLMWTTVLALAVLVGIFAFLSLIDQLEDAGQGNYDAYEAITYVILTLPRLAYELMPIAAMIGGMACIAVLSRNSELEVIKLSGASEHALVGLLAKAALVVVLFSIFIGEFVVPVSEIKARYQRSIALTEQVAMQTKYGFWARDGNSFVNIRKILPGNLIEEIYIYEFDDQARLRSSITAKNARYIEDRWVLEGVDRTIIDGFGVTRERYDKVAWESWIDDGLINLVIINPLYMSLWNLSGSIRVLKSNSQSAAAYEQAFYGKLVRPFTILAMVILAIPLVAMRKQSDGLGQHVFTGALAGVIFYFVNSASGHIGIVYDVHPFISSTVPMLLLYLVLFRLFSGWKPVLSARIDREKRDALFRFFYRWRSVLFRRTGREKPDIPYQPAPREIPCPAPTRTRQRGKTSWSDFSSRVARRLGLSGIYARRAFRGFAVLFSIARRNMTRRGVSGRRYKMDSRLKKRLRR